MTPICTGERVLIRDFFVKVRNFIAFIDGPLKEKVSHRFRVAAGTISTHCLLRGVLREFSQLAAFPEEKIEDADPACKEVVDNTTLASFAERFKEFEL
jgi:hypothetical protein